MVAIYHNIYDSLADFIAGMDANKMLSFHAPSDLQERIDTLLEKKKISTLSSDEEQELEHYFILEHIVRLAKAKARLKLKQAA
jgi:hypothetical protein